MITPVVGQCVWFYPHGSDLNAPPLAAIIAGVCTPTRVNLAVFDSNGVAWPTPPTSVLLVQEPSQRPESGRAFCTWPVKQESAVVSDESSQAEDLVDAVEPAEESKL